MQGLDAPGRLRGSTAQRSGWQRDVGVLDDRDLKFFDAVLASLSRDYKVDEKRIYASGHGAGGAFTYVLWAARGERIAAVAPSGTAGGLDLLTNLKSKPVLLLAGEQDSRAKFDWQKLTMDGLRKLNRCGEGRPWESCCTLYPSDIGAPVVTYIHPGRHEFPTNAAASIVKFFKEHPQLCKEHPQL
jgi:polyhydroxybutyrate depolymerase